MRPCHEHRHALKRACPIHSRAHMRTVQPTGMHIVHAFVPLTGAPMHAYPVGRHALVHAYFWIARARGGPHP
jgi:hypothetical protein